MHSHLPHTPILTYVHPQFPHHQQHPRIVSIIGLVVYLVGVVGTTVWYSREHYHAPPDAMAWRWKGVPHFFGVAVYALEVNECDEGDGVG